VGARINGNQCPRFPPPLKKYFSSRGFADSGVCAFNDTPFENQ
jgi:hypothetical protein